MATVGLVFLGSPFRGTHSQFLASAVAWVMQLAQSHDGIIKDLVYDNAVLLDNLHKLAKLIGELSIPTSCFFELKATNFGKLFGWLRKEIVQNSRWF